MQLSRPLARWTDVLLGLMAVLAGCTYRQSENDS